MDGYANTLALPGTDLFFDFAVYVLCFKEKAVQSE